MLGIFRREKKDVESLKQELQLLQAELKRIDSDVSQVYNAVNDLLMSPQRTEAAVSDLQGKIKEIFDVTKLTLQNHDMLQEQNKKLAELESSFNAIKTSLENTHIQRELDRETKTPIGHFSDTSVNSVNSSLNYQLKSVSGSLASSLGPSVSQDFSGLSTLTDMEKRTFATLAAIIKENEAKEAHLDVLIRELYPEFPVEKRRSTVSNFLKRLESFGLIAKERRGRTKTIRLTEKGLSAIGQEAFKQLEKSLIRK